MRIQMGGQLAILKLSARNPAKITKNVVRLSGFTVDQQSFQQVQLRETGDLQLLVPQSSMRYYGLPFPVP